MRTDMTERKCLIIVLLCFSLLMLTNGLAFAERQCNNQIVNSDGTLTVTSDCTGSYTKTSEITRHPWPLVNKFLDNVQQDIQQFQDRLAQTFQSQDRSKQTTADTRAREQEAIEAQQMKQQQQEIQSENLKQQQEMRKQH